MFNWSKTAANNATADPAVNYREQQSPGSLNDSARAAMASLAKWRDDNAGMLTTAGTSTAYTLTTNEGISLVDGLTVTGILHATNGASPTLNVDGTGAKAIHSVVGTALPSGSCLINGVYSFVYNLANTAWIVRSYFALVIPTGAITSGMIADGTIATADIANDAVTYAKLQNISAQLKILGRKTAAAGDVEECSLSDILDFIGSAAQGDILYRDSGAWARLGAGTARQVLQTGGASANPSWVTLGAPDVIAEEQQTSGTDGGSFSAGARRTRLLNTLVRNNGSIASLGSNQVTIPAGTYYAQFRATGWQTGSHKTWLRNVTDGTDLVIGSSEYLPTSSGVSGNSHGSGVFTIGGSKALSLQHQCSNTDGKGFGNSTGFGTEIYSQLQLWRML